jgi:heme o synthase
MPPRPNFLESIALLIRPLLSLFVSFSALSTFFYFRHSIGVEAFYLFSGVFLLACSSSTINQVQEREIDSRMERTRRRPLPLKQFTVGPVIIFSVASGLSGLSLLFWGAYPLAALIGAIAVFTYNFVYTHLKKRTSLALIPGAIAGALPVLIGCAGALGSIEKKAVVITVFMFLWQVPHFLLLLLRFESDYRSAGISTAFLRISPAQLRMVIFIWALAAIAVTALFPMFGIMRSITLIMIIAGLNVWMIIKIANGFRTKTVFPTGRILYIYQGIVLIVLTVQGFLGMKVH